MRDLHDPELTLSRIRPPKGTMIENTHTDGLFIMSSPIDGQELAVITSAGCGWDHVSVSRTNRCPNWQEMEFVRRKIFHPNETVMQLHPPLTEYITGMYPGERSRYVLHLWRPWEGVATIPRPPNWMVGANSLEQLREHNNTADREIAEFMASYGKYERTRPQ